MTSADPIRVEFEGRAHAVHVFGGGLESLCKRICAEVPTGRLILVSDDRVARLYSREVLGLLLEQGREARLLEFPEGEASKSAALVAQLWERAFAGPLDRSDCIIAIGGGVCGDLAGFVAATLMRGISLLHVPTTTIAMSDSAIGGKTGVNLSVGKNLVGAFYPPRAVLVWMKSLDTLAERQLKSGLAEIVKSAIIDSPDSFSRVADLASQMAAGDRDALEEGVLIAARLKARLVSEDPREHGPRRLLNLGHTFGHAIEHASGYGEVTHGEAVSMGIVVAARYAHDLGIATATFVDRVYQTLDNCGLPVDVPALSLEEWLAPMKRDKKREGDAVRLILPAAGGDVRVRMTPFEQLKNWMTTREICGSPTSEPQNQQGD